MAVSDMKKIAIIGNFVVFTTTLLMALLGDESALFPMKISKVSRRYPNKLKADPKTFAIWNFIYTFQALWIFYTLTLIVRKEADDIIPLRCFFLYSFARICSTTYRVILSRDLSVVGPFVCLLLSATALNMCLLFLLKSANPDENAGVVGHNKFDIWCTRVFVPNAIVFYSMWQDIASTLSFNKVLIYNLKASHDTAAVIALSFLISIVIGWFVLENFVIERYTRFLFLEYIVLIIASSGLLKKQWKDGKAANEVLILVFLILSVLFLIARIIIIIIKEKPRLMDKIGDGACMIKTSNSTM